MRKFSFRLQSILDLRQHEEEQRRLELGAATNKRNAIQRAIDERQALRRSALIERSSAADAVDVGWRGAAEEYAYRLAVEMRKLEKQLVTAEEERAAAAARYGEAKQKAELMQKLHDKRAREHIKTERKAEQNRLDEVAQHIHAQGGR